MKKITIIDYGTSNLKSINAAFSYLGYSTSITNDEKKIKKSDLLVLPGVGSFPVVMKYLIKKKLDNSIKEYLLTNKPFLGICLGMQVLFEYSHEFKKTKGLGVLKGSVNSLENINNNKKFLIPNTGWMTIKKNKYFKEKNLISVNKNINLFFTHSFFAKPKNKNLISSYINVSDKQVCSSVQYNNIYGMQFHPEKSGIKGLNLLKKFSSL
tara:strand:+ start:2585 stop:3214 length:630 start_codon:yes stop_codon:yes gene_type:complete